MKRTLPKAASYVAVSLAAWLVGTVGTRAETITGTFRYADFNPGNNTSRLEPIRFCKVEVWGRRPRDFGLLLWGKDADTTTDANGSISVGINFQTAGVVYGLRITAQNYAAIVWPNNAVHLDPFFQEPALCKRFM